MRERLHQAARTPMTARVRPGGLADAEAILAVQAASWAATYKGLLPERIFPRAGDENRILYWRRVLISGDTATRVAIDDRDRLLGFACGGRPRDPRLPAAGELYALYLLPEAQGRGLGRRLLADIAQVLAGRGAAHMALWVLAANASAIAFYAHVGGRPSRRQVSREHGVDFDEIAYLWDPIHRAWR